MPYKDPERARENARQRRALLSPKERYERARRMDLKRRFGMTPQDYEEMYEGQWFECAICNQPETTTSGKNRAPRRLSVDHDHVTGEVRGLLCARCNTGLGFIERQEEWLERAQYYLKFFAEYPSPFSPDTQFIPTKAPFTKKVDRDVE